MYEVATRILKDKRNALIAYCLGAMVTVEMYIALFPTIRDQAQQLNKLLEAYPKGLMEAFGFSGTEALFSTLESYMSTEYFSFFWPILIITMMIGFANAMIVGEVENGTIELTLSQPLSRLKLFFSRYLAGVVYLLAFNFFSIFIMIPFAKLHDIGYQLDHFYTIFGISFLFGLVVFSIALVCSAIFNEKGRAIAVSSAILLGMYILNIISTLKDNLEKLKYVTIFHYFNPGNVFGKNEIVEYSVPVFLGAILILTTIAIIVFSKKDIAV